MDKRGLGFALGILSAIFWGTNGTFCALLGNYGLNEVTIALLAPIINFSCFFLVMLFTNRKGFALSLKPFLILVLDGLAAGAVNISFVKSVSYFPVGIVSTLVFCNVFVIMVFSRVFFKIKITAQKLISAVAALFGVSLVLNVFNGGVHLNLTGLFWVLMSILAWSTMVTIEKYLLESGVEGSAILMYTSLFAILALSFTSPPWHLAADLVQVTKESGDQVLLTILGFGLIPQAACYFLYITGLKYIDPSYIQVAYSLDPVTASLLGYLVFGQSLSVSQLIGILIIVFVVGYLQFKEHREVNLETT